MITASPVDPKTMHVFNQPLGINFWVLTGSTYEYREAIKSAGGYWDNWTRRWYMRTDEDLQRLMDAIKEKV